MDSREIGGSRGLSREARATPGGGTSQPAAPLPPAPLAPLTRPELLQILAAKPRPAREWTRCVFYGEDAHVSVGSLQSALAKQRLGLPAFVYGSRTLRSELNAQALMGVIFPDGVPPVDKMSLQLQLALRNLVHAAKTVYDCPGMESLEIDKGIIVVCNEEAFITMMETCIAKSGQEL